MLVQAVRARTRHKELSGNIREEIWLEGFALSLKSWNAFSLWFDNAGSLGWFSPVEAASRIKKAWPSDA